ncbi:hypothetical protein B9Z55_009182 [Caenorhabditis nigoni]|uniref:BTB domain-containing protein n=1 Tax=Caenorhabditis nigoni TaxID=1611254 RepID=A0A2G5URR0_9PELO|nr:hypothetical protein B9Z55_009182 [Caenorhabditis nigoni]
MLYVSSENMSKMKSFSMKHAFKNVLNLNENDEQCGEAENHFNVFWKLRILNEDQKYLVFYLDCLRTDETCSWSIPTEFEVIFGENQARKLTKCHTFSQFCPSIRGNIYMTWQTVESSLETDGSLVVEFHVKINNFNKIAEKKLRNFEDEAAQRASDVMLKIGNHKFYVSKSLLSSKCSYFKALFFGNFEESGKSEIELKNIHPNDLQTFLEVLYGEPAIDEDTCESILDFAEYFDCKSVIEKCEHLILLKSINLSPKAIFNIASRHNMGKLKYKCISELQTSADIRSIIPKNPEEIDNKIWKELLLKTISLFEDVEIQFENAQKTLETQKNETPELRGRILGRRFH